VPITKVLTAKLLENLKPAPPGERYSINDALVPGLAVRVTDRGVRSFVMAKRWPGGSPHSTARTLGRVGAMKLTDAREKAIDWIKLHQQGIDPKREEEKARLAQTTAQANTFGVVVDDFISRKLKGQRRGKAVEAEIRRDLLPFLKNRPITEITKRDIVKRIEAIRDRSPAQAHHLLSHCKVLFNWAIARDIYGLEVSPCDRLRAKELIGTMQPRQRVLTDAELRAIWHHSEALGYPFAPLFRMVMLTGQRRSEVAGARWREFDLDAAVWTIPPERFKSASTHIVPLTDDALAVLATCPRFAGGDCVFTSKNGATPPSEIDPARHQLMKLIEAELGALPDWTLHDVRRTVRTRLSGLRIPEPVAELVIGHGKKGLARIYDQHLYADEMREALDLWAGQLRKIVGRPAGKVLTMTGVAGG